MQGNLYKLDRKTISELVMQIISIPQINCNKELIKRAMPMFVKYKKISFADICLTCYADINNAKPLLTYDKLLAKNLPDFVKNLN